MRFYFILETIYPFVYLTIGLGGLTLIVIALLKGRTLMLSTNSLALLSLYFLTPSLLLCYQKLHGKIVSDLGSILLNFYGAVVAVGIMLLLFFLAFRSMGFATFLLKGAELRKAIQSVLERLEEDFQESEDGFQLSTRPIEVDLSGSPDVWFALVEISPTENIEGGRKYCRRFRDELRQYLSDLEIQPAGLSIVFNVWFCLGLITSGILTWIYCATTP